MLQWFKSTGNRACAQFIFAHGAGAGSDSEFMQTMAKLISQQGIDVALFDFQYMQIAKETGKRRPPDRAPKLLAYFAEVLAERQSELPLFIGGKSMGGRMASMLCTEQNIPKVTGVVAFGYPFHPPGKPEKRRTDHFADVPCPFLVLQGERDTFGNQQELAELEVVNPPEIKFLKDGDHSLKPRKKSGITEQENLQLAADYAAQFIMNLVAGDEQ
tara:strand:+ start:960 stop:1604 length:645 start_codon:yes stop_codon:yes gene_type:complete